jgi:hypothetical protein
MDGTEADLWTKRRRVSGLVGWWKELNRHVGCTGGNGPAQALGFPGEDVIVIVIVKVEAKLRVKSQKQKESRMVAHQVRGCAVWLQN